MFVPWTLAPKVSRTVWFPRRSFGDLFGDGDRRRSSTSVDVGDAPAPAQPPPQRRASMASVAGAPPPVSPLGAVRRIEYYAGGSSPHSPHRRLSCWSRTLPSPLRPVLYPSVAGASAISTDFHSIWQHGGVHLCNAAQTQYC